ncbi:CRISPR-associated primase-polymerase type A1 [Fervidobacterium riparium]|uniref:TOTE conflict system primase domain-containing protein n=1 Tax=Fervidobacterium gondwanense DSM 13020 TaxID=1121883 RepID=A0A1M7TGD8_FERGO|nr:CRISPR-associated primase-polymerase type A1 [Fervidobacterium gondwanense]UXF00252.1 hypothetical protein IB67_01250 [Fervidobacterium riparium]SHN69713.1 hypothetical protein SAMN02745226_01960 [Fervidobacterium gondwanense DSM 13020]
MSFPKDVKEKLNLAVSYEKKFEFNKALEVYKELRDYLTVEDGSLIRFAKLLVEFEEYSEAKEVLEKIVLNKKVYTKELVSMLATVYENIGYTEKAIVLYKKVGNKEKVRELEQEREISHPKKSYVDKFMSLFSGREDVFAVQTPEGYYPVRRPMNSSDVLEHFAGRKTLGVYVLRSDDTVKFAAYDVDVRKDFENDLSSEFHCKETAKMLYYLLRSDNLNAYIEFSGRKGYHLWIFFDIPVAAFKVRVVLAKILEKLQVPESVKVEIFPKQDKLNGGLGNLIKVPFGVHAKTKKRCVFLDEKLSPISNQLDFLLNISPNSSYLLESLFREYVDTDYDIQDSEIESIKTKKVSSKVKKESNQVITISQETSTFQKSTISSSKVFKKILRNEIHSSRNSAELTLLESSCFVVDQIMRKIETLAHISAEEEKILVSLLKHLPNGYGVAKKVLEKTIDYSEEKVRNLFDEVGNIPATCEEIKALATSLNIPLDLSKCVCRFKQVFNTPLNYVFSESQYLERLEPEEIAERLIVKAHEKVHIEVEMRKLKELLKQKLSDSKVIEFEDGRIVVDDRGEIRIEFI